MFLCLELNCASNNLCSKADLQKFDAHLFWYFDDHCIWETYYLEAMYETRRTVVKQDLPASKRLDPAEPSEWHREHCQLNAPSSHQPHQSIGFHERPE
jgi:hypothetical protein